MCLFPAVPLLRNGFRDVLMVDAIEPEATKPLMAQLCRHRVAAGRGRQIPVKRCFKARPVGCRGAQ